jgi:hypothetical protein
MSEGIDVDFKQSVDGVHAEDLVAFANSAAGGAILVGVREIEGKDGRQRGVPVGIRLGDAAKLKIMNKAMDCSPPVQLSAFAENMGDKPFYRIEISAGPLRPYCTRGGTYKTRTDGRSQALHPEELLDLFVQREGARFRERFAEATQKVVEDLGSALGLIGEIQDTVEQKLDDIGSTLDWAEFRVDETVSAIDKVKDAAENIETEVGASRERILALLKHHEIADPVKAAARARFSKELEERLRRDKNLAEVVRSGGQLSVNSPDLNLFTQEEASQIVQEVFLRILKDQK